MDNEDIREVFTSLGPISIRRMFSGKGVYLQGVIVAIEYGDELRLKADSLLGEKAVAFFRISRSCRRTSFSRRSRFSSSTTSSPGGGRLGVSIRRSRLLATQRVSVDTPTPRSSAIYRLVRPQARTSRTASSSNALVKRCAMVALLLQPKLSTFTGQVQRPGGSRWWALRHPRKENAGAPRCVRRRIRYTELWRSLATGSIAEASAIMIDPSRRPVDMTEAELEAWRGALGAVRSGTSAAKAKAAKSTLTAADAGWVDHGNAVVLLTMLGDLDDAFAQARVYQMGRPIEPPFLFLPPTAPLRADPRFMKIAQTLGLTAYWRATQRWPDFCTEPNLPYDCRAEAAKTS